VTTLEGGFKSTCLATCEEPLPPGGVYVVGNFGMLKDGVLATGTSGLDLTDVYVDERRAVHACGNTTDRATAVYLLDGQRTNLPKDAWANMVYTGEMHVEPNGDVYIAGYQMAGTRSQAVLWKNGARQPLEGTDTANGDEARAVRVHNGVVYVAGMVKQSYGGYHTAIWRNNVRYDWSLVDTESRTMGVTANGTIYVGGYSGVYSTTVAGGFIDSSHTVSGQSVLHTGGGSFGDIFDVFVDGNDFYAVGWEGSDATYFRNQVRTYLPRSLWGGGWAEAMGVCVSETGAVYIVGQNNAGRAVMWVNGVAQLLPPTSAATHAVFARGVEE
jgi:hypothetical protein